MDKKRTIIQLAKFPPPYGGVTVGNERLYNYMLKNKVKFKIFNISKQNIYKEHIVNIYPYKFKYFVKTLVNYRSFRELCIYLRESFILDLPYNEMFKFYYKAILISNYLNKDQMYSAYCNHLGKDQIIFWFLKFMGYSVDIHTYLHGSGIIESYDKNPKLYKKLTNLSNTYMVASNYMKELYKDRKDKVSDVRITPPFIVDDYYNSSITNKENILLFVGSFTEVKNPIYIIEELNKCKEVLEEFRMVFVGKGPLRAEMNNKIEEYRLTNIEIIGELNLSETEKIFEKSKYLILPSKREPFGRVIVEAMAKRTIPIVANVGGMPELFSEKAGFVFEFEQENLAKILRSINNIDYEKMSDQSYKEAINYNETNMAKKWVEVLLEN